MTTSIFITGAAHGIGEAIARMAAADGYRVGIFDLDGEGATETATSLPDAIALQGSVSEESDIERALEEFGEVLDAFVNNAGIVRFGPLIEMNEADWRAVVDVNLTGTFLGARAAARRMMDAGSGAIVNIASINGIAPGPNSGAYAAAKGRGGDADPADVDRMGTPRGQGQQSRSRAHRRGDVRADLRGPGVP